jgi:hypothetical protein
MKKPRDVIRPRWGAFLIKGKRAERLLFSVTARDRDEVIKLAFEENAVPERDHWRISVQREA